MGTVLLGAYLVVATGFVIHDIVGFIRRRRGSSTTPSS